MITRLARHWPAWLPRDMRWLLAAAVTAYVLYITRNWRFPNSSGVSFPGLWAGLVVSTAVVRRVARGSFGAVPYLAILAAWGMVLGDVTQFWSQAFRDLHIYVKAGEHFLNGQPVYMTEVLDARPDDLSNYPYLYPPMTLPLLAVLAALPGVVVDWGWLAASFVIALWSLRRFGLSWPWAVAAIAWTPLLQGLYVGNVAVPLLGLFAAAPFAGRAAGLAVAPVFKLYSGVATLWLVRERRWWELAAGVAFVVFVALVTLPLVGFGSWLDWLDGLRIYRLSEVALPDYLYGFGLPRYIPEIAWLAVAFVVVGVALRSRGKDGLARLGLATVVASPSLFAHGFLVAIPALLGLRATWLWAALGVTSVAPDVGWWVAVGVVIASWFVPGLLREPSAAGDALHPLGVVLEPWPEADADQREPRITPDVVPRPHATSPIEPPAEHRSGPARDEEPRTDGPASDGAPRPAPIPES